MIRTLIVLDSHYLCHRAFHTTQELSHNGQSTEIIFGFLKAIAFFKDMFVTDNVAFCFEHPTLFRQEVYPAYKQKRRAKEMSLEERRKYNNFISQVSELQKRYLPEIGFRNVFSFKGMESDDIMAALASRATSKERVVLITSDADMFQCLNENVSIYSPQKKKLLGLEWFLREYKIHPKKWAVVKAIAGCSGDGVEGIRGVGELTALRYLRGELPTTSKAYQSILSDEGKAIVRRNRALVQLPYRGCPVPHLKEDRVTKRAWLDVCNRLGMRSLAGRAPVMSWKTKK